MRRFHGKRFRKYIYILSAVWGHLVFFVSKPYHRRRGLQGFRVLQSPAEIGLKLRQISATDLRSKSKEAGKHPCGLPALITTEQDWRTVSGINRILFLSLLAIADKFIFSRDMLLLYAIPQICHTKVTVLVFYIHRKYLHYFNDFCNMFLTLFWRKNQTSMNFITKNII